MSVSFLALAIQQANRILLRHIVLSYVACLALPHFTTVSCPRVFILQQEIFIISVKFLFIVPCNALRKQNF